MRRVPFCLLPIIFVAMSMVCGSGHFVFGAEGQGNESSSVQESHAGFGADYTIGIGDVLEISVWREPMISGETVVRGDGKISVALLGDVQAAGRTPMNLRDEIQSRLKEFVGEPTVTVSVRTPTSQRIYVIGEVRAPGEFELAKDLTVVQAIARAGGFTDFADKDDIVLLRKENGVEKRIRVDFKKIVKGKDLSQNIPLRANDTIIVP